MVIREASGKDSNCTVSGRNKFERKVEDSYSRGMSSQADTVNTGVGMLEEHPGGWCGQSKYGGQTQIVSNFNLCRE